MTFRRTAATDIELGGQTILAGEKVVMFYPSGNWDTDAFDRPERLNLARDPNPHVGFGGGGLHFCLGAHVARAAAGHLPRAVSSAAWHPVGRADVSGGQFRARRAQHAVHLLMRCQR
ncbi:hypothetical protein MMARJ_51190 [Mycobacterium marseillense]|uniref:Cytochrome P450 n=1 Tax=Mycobacterium marseillense TaxID=701042 RepID=A0ABN6A2T2_9MYCO|nr:hypothetical protein MMARJ_51190 [Mycobacterium marseillense]